ncbi:MAG: thioesterase family protein [Actinomycetota bacterium]
MAQPFVHRLRVRYAECDLQGVVFNAHYMTYLDEAMTELWRQTVGGGYQGMVTAGTDMVVAEARLRFLSPARFDDEVAIEAQTTRLGTTGMTTELRIARDGETLAEAELRHVFVATDGSGKVPLPDEVRRGLEPNLRAHLQRSAPIRESGASAPETPPR